MLMVLQTAEELFILCFMPFLMIVHVFLWIRSAVMEVFCMFCDFLLKGISLEMSSALTKATAGLCMMLAQQTTGNILPVFQPRTCRSTPH